MRFGSHLADLILPPVFFSFFSSSLSLSLSLWRCHDAISGLVRRPLPPLSSQLVNANPLTPPHHASLLCFSVFFSFTFFSATRESVDLCSPSPLPLTPLNRCSFLFSLFSDNDATAALSVLNKCSLASPLALRVNFHNCLSFSLSRPLS